MEHVVELVTYLAAGVIIATLIIVLLVNWKFEKDMDNLEQLRNEDADIGFERVDKEGFAIKARDFWMECNQSFNKTLSLYVYENKTQLEGNLSKEFLFDVYKQLSWCRSIQSKNMSCGVREDVNISELTLPKVVVVTCLNNTLLIE